MNRPLPLLLRGRVGVAAPFDANWGSRAGLERVRSFAGVNLPVGQRQTVEIVYLNQYGRRAATDDQINHVGVLTLAHRF